MDILVGKYLFYIASKMIPIHSIDEQKNDTTLSRIKWDISVTFVIGPLAINLARGSDEHAFIYTKPYKFAVRRLLLI